jgi:hypothetical protein
MDDAKDARIAQWFGEAQNEVSTLLLSLQVSSTLF